jgi:hypothetical protein
MFLYMSSRVHAEIFKGVLGANFATLATGFVGWTVYRRWVPREYMVHVLDTFTNKTYVGMIYDRNPVRLVTVDRMKDIFCEQHNVSKSRSVITRIEKL